MSMNSTALKSSAIINPEETKNNPMNNSTSKMLYSFSKDKRFPKENGIDLPYYQLPNINNKRATSMGFGNKVLFPPNQSPSPNKYNIVRTFDIKTKTGPSFGLGRSEIKASQTSIFQTRNAPGPGQYSPIQQIYKRSTSVRSRLPDHYLDQRMKVPGPGQYDTNRSTIYGKMSDSKFGNIRSSKICQDSSLQKLRHQQIKNQPAPWTYNLNIGTTRGDKLLDEKKGYKFGFSARKGLNVNPNTNPGPGQYNIFSEFAK